MGREEQGIPDRGKRQCQGPRGWTSSVIREGKDGWACVLGMQAGNNRSQQKQTVAWLKNTGRTGLSGTRGATDDRYTPPLPVTAGPGMVFTKTTLVL